MERKSAMGLEVEPRCRGRKGDLSSKMRKADGGPESYLISQDQNSQPTDAMNSSVGALLLVLATTALVTISLVEPPAGSPGPQPSRPEPELERGPPQERRIALTFDAGGGNDELPALLHVLEKESVAATFFLTGRWADEFPRCAAQIVARGHVVGNHTWGYKDLTKLADADIEQEILRADDRFALAFGPRYLPLFRAPFGEVNERVLRIVEKLGFRAVRWSIDTLDSMEPRKTAAFIEHRVLDRSDEELSGAIVLMHVGCPETCSALPGIIQRLRQRGFEIVPVETWVGMPAPALTSSHVATRPRHHSLRLPDLRWAGSPLFDDQAGATVSWTRSASAPETTNPMALAQVDRSIGKSPNHRNTPTRP